MSQSIMKDNNSSNHDDIHGRNDENRQQKRPRDEYEGDIYHSSNTSNIGSLSPNENSNQRSQDERETNHHQQQMVFQHNHPQMFYDSNQQQIFGAPNFSMGQVANPFFSFPQSMQLHPNAHNTSPFYAQQPFNHYPNLFHLQQGAPQHLQHISPEQLQEFQHHPMHQIQANGLSIGMHFPFPFAVPHMPHLNPISNMAHMSSQLAFTSLQGQVHTSDDDKVAQASKSIVITRQPLPQVVDITPGIQPIKKQKKDIPEWLVAVGEACHSGRQLESGQDLTKIKKKYRYIKCLFCEEFNNTSPWAAFKSRKYESETFLEHERSTHHIKAVLRRSASLGVPDPNQLIAPGQSYGAYGQHTAHHMRDGVDNRDMSSAAAAALMYPGRTSNISPSSHQSSQSASTLDDRINTHQPQNHLNPLPLSQHPIPMHLMRLNYARGVELQNNAPVQPPPLVDHSKTKTPPIWLKVDGRLCHSDRQAASGESLTGVKKKYKHMMCTYCHDFNPSSPWATSKTRKCESSVFNEHERSHHHRKAVNTRDLGMGIMSGYDLSSYRDSINPSMHPIPGLGSLQLSMGFPMPHQMGNMAGLYMPQYPNMNDALASQATTTANSSGSQEEDSDSDSELD